MTTESSRSAAERLAFLCMWQLQKMQEGGGGHSEIFQWVNPLPGVLTLRRLREEAGRECWAAHDLPILDLAEAVLSGLGEGGEGARELIQASIAVASQKYQAGAIGQEEKEEKRLWQAQRLVMLIWLMEHHGVRTNSRATERMMEDETICIGTSPEVTPNDTWREHVVPCLYIHLLVRERLARAGLGKDGLVSVRQVEPIARVVARIATLAYISNREGGILDKGADAMRSGMPEGWRPDQDCVMVRLCTRGIRLSEGPLGCDGCPHTGTL